MSAALSIYNGTAALVCFPDDYVQKKCEVFNSRISRSTFETNYRHSAGSLGLYRGKPTTVGGYGGDERNKVETLSSSGWRTLNDFPKKYFEKSYISLICFSFMSYHVLVGLPSGSLLLAGGEDENREVQTAIWLLENDIWKEIGDLENVSKKEN